MCLPWLKLRRICWKRNQRLGLIIRLGGLEIHKRPWQRFSKRLSPHTRMLTNCGSRVSVSQLSSPLCICISIVNSAYKSIDLALRGKLLSSLQRSKKKMKRKLLNCAILPIAKSLNWAWRCKVGATLRGGQVGWYGFNEHRELNSESIETMATSLALTNSSHRQRQCISICSCISRDTFSHAFQLQTR